MKCGFVGVEVVFLEEVCHYRMCFEVSYIRISPYVSIDILLPERYNGLNASTNSAYMQPCAMLGQ